MTAGSAGSGSVLDPVGTVLFVDDDPSILSALLRVFARMPSVRPLIAPDGNAALDVLKRFPVDVIVTDQNMPGITGIGLLATCRRNYPTMTRVLLTAQTDRKTVSVAATHASADFVFAKPWDDEGLKTGILSALTKAGKRKRTEQLLLWAGRTPDKPPSPAEDMVARMEERDPVLALHSLRVAESTRLFGDDLGLNVVDLYVAALLHDVGKTGTEDNGVAPGELEAKVPDTHPVSGETILLRLTGGTRIAPWVRGHHEKFDGSGYPDGLRGTAIPLGARVLRVVDAYDHLSLSGMSSEKILEVIMKNAESEFDPRIAKRFGMEVLAFAAAGGHSR